MEKYQLRKSPPKKILKEYSELERTLLFGRSIKNKDDAKRFLSVSYDRDILDPFLMTGMERAVSRIIKAMKSGEKIAIFGDFDADGLCATVCWKDFFFRAGYENVTFYIPHRHEEGFGVSVEALSSLSDEGATLVITVDCGIADSKVFDDSRELGLDIIVTDHHEPVNGLPKVLAVVDPKRKGCSYPNPNLCGAGVAFKVIQGVLSKDRFGIPEGHEKWLLDLVAVATISDSVPLVGENRALARYGLLVLRKSQRVGIMKLCRKLYLPQPNLTEDDVGFMIAPRLNAASRMGDIKDAFTLLSTYDDAEAEEAVKGLERVNNERKGVVASMVKEVKAKTLVLENSEVIVTGNPNWRPSLLGLVANSLAEEYSKPVFLWGRDGSQTIKGSCRSYGGVDLLALMSSAEKNFKQFGGHRFAGGFSVDFKSVHTLRESLNEAYSKTENTSCEEITEVDFLLSLDDVDETFYKKIERFSPFGVENPKPVFRFSNLLIERVKLFGKKSEHLELTFKKSSGREMKAIGFFKTQENFNKRIKEGERVDLVATVEKSFFGGRVELRLRIVDTV